MNELIITNSDKKEIVFNDFPSGDEVRLIKDMFPNLKSIVFRNCVIKDFSLIEMFSDYGLYFEDSVIEEYSYPIRLKASVVYFENTRIDFEKLFFMTDMPNLKIIYLFYDSIEGVELFKPYIHLLKMYPLLERIRLMMATDNVTYYDMKHTKVFKKGFDNSNVDVMLSAKLQDNMDFIHYMPFCFPKTFDGIFQIFDMNLSLWRINKLFWVNPEFMSYYDSKFKSDDLKKIREELIKLKKYGPIVKEHLGKAYKGIDYTGNPLYTWPDLNDQIIRILRHSRLGVKTVKENDEPEESSIYGIHGTKLYNTSGHMIIVNERGSIISDYSVDQHTKKLENNLLPF